MSFLRAHLSSDEIMDTFFQTLYGFLYIAKQSDVVILARSTNARVGWLYWAGAYFVLVLRFYFHPTTCERISRLHGHRESLRLEPKSLQIPNQMFPVTVTVECVSA